MGAAEDLSARHEPTADRRHRFAIVCAAGAVLLLYAVGGYFGARLLRGYAADTARMRQAMISSLTSAQKARPHAAAPSPDAGARPVDVQVALTVNRIGAVAFKESTWTADFNVSFRWRGDAVEPGKDFRVANGQIDQREKVEGHQRGGERYEQYRVVARIAKSFDASRFPFGDEGLAVEIEDSTHGLNALRYLADESHSGVPPEAMSPHMRLQQKLVGVTVRRAESPHEAHSRFFLAMLIGTKSAPIFLSLFQALFAAVAVAFVVFFIKPIHVDPRFGLPVGGFFAAVANNTFVAGALPPAERTTLAFMVNAAGLSTIFLILVESAVSLYILDTLGRERLSRFCDRTFFAVMLLGYVAVNVALPLSARG